MEKQKTILFFLLEMRSIISCDANKIFKAGKMFLVNGGGGGEMGPWPRSCLVAHPPDVCKCLVEKQKTILFLLLEMSIVSCDANEMLMHVRCFWSWWGGEVGSWSWRGRR